MPDDLEAAVTRTSMPGTLGGRRRDPEIGPDEIAPVLGAAVTRDQVPKEARVVDCKGDVVSTRSI